MEDIPADGIGRMRMHLYKSSVLLIRDCRFVLFSLHISQYSRNAEVLRHLPGRLPRTTVRCERKVFITFEIWILFLQKCMDSLQEAFIHGPELCESRFIMNVRALFNVFWTVEYRQVR